jgi:hypothetical protein
LTVRCAPPGTGGQASGRASSRGPVATLSEAGPEVVGGGGDRHQTWRSFLRDHADPFRAGDLFTVQTLTFKALYVLVFLYPRPPRGGARDCHRPSHRRSPCVKSLPSGLPDVGALTVGETVVVTPTLQETFGAFNAIAAEPARAAARAADADFARGVDRGPLQGVPLGIKDLIATRDAPTTANSRVLDPAWGEGRRRWWAQSGWRVWSRSCPCRLGVRMRACG